MMKAVWIAIVSAALVKTLGSAVTKPHVLAFGKWSTIQWQPDDTSKAQDVKVRALLVDGKVKEITLGPAHEVSDHIFVVQRIFRVNDSLPQESLRWRWEKGGWLLVDRVSGRVQLLNLPEFDRSHSQVSWFRDYGAYCGISDDGQKDFAIIVQVARRKPLLKKALRDSSHEPCAPAWQRNPVRVSFATKEDATITFTVNSLAVDIASDDTGTAEDED